MSDLSRRDFLKLAGTGSAAATVVVGGGVLAKMKVLSSSADGEMVTFRAVAGVPGKPLPAYASFVLDGRVDLAAGTGTIVKTVYAGAPEAMSSIALPDLSRTFRVTSVEGDSVKLRVHGMVDGRSTLRQGEPSTMTIEVDRRAGEVRAPLVDRDIVLALQGS